MDSTGSKVILCEKPDFDLFLWDDNAFGNRMALFNFSTDIITGNRISFKKMTDCAHALGEVISLF